MSAGGGGGGPGSLDFDLNLAPIIDCFTVLITFMLVSASFISISIFDAGFTPAEAVGDPNPPPITVEMNVTVDKGYELVVKGQVNQTLKFTALPEMVEGMKQFKTKYASVTSMTITADDGVEYEKIIKAMEAARPVFPSMVLGGF